MINFRKISGFIAAALFLILAIIFIAQLILKLTGNSPTHIEILYTGMGSIASYLFFFSQKVSLFMEEMREFKETTKNSFVRIREDTDKINEKLDFIAEKVK
ncbi:hypothetical protein HYV89_01205 [Candidatus Woesearchaeota archaeon]|nr:hypothetical protein [Candidatus Woesearchaeota archaeon]